MPDYRRNLNADQVLGLSFDEIEGALRVTGESVSIAARTFEYAPDGRRITVRGFTDPDATQLHITITIDFDDQRRATKVTTQVGP